MKYNKCTIELSLAGEWHEAARVVLTGKPEHGVAAATTLEYLDD